MNHRPIVFIDIETNGSAKGFGSITDIGALKVVNGKVVDTFNQLLCPDEPIPWYITNLTGITNDMVWKAPKFGHIAEDFEKFLDGCIFAAHSVNFDYGYIKAAFREYGIEYNSDRFCTVQLSRRLYKGQKGHSLDRVIERLNVEVKNRHRGYDDAEVLYKLFRKWYREDEISLFNSINQIMVCTTKKRRLLSSNKLL